MKLALSRRLATAGTVALTTVAVAFAGTPAHAADSTSFSTSDTRASTSAAPSIRVTVGSGELSRRTTTARATIVSSAPLTGATADVYVAGKRRQSIRLAYQSGPITFSSRAGFGVGQLRNVVVTYMNADGTTGRRTVSSNTFRIRRLIDSGAVVKMRKSGSKIRVSGSRWRAAQPNATWIRVPQVIVQKRSGGAWRTVKKVRPSSTGKFSFSFRSSKKVRYRAQVRTTSTLKGMTTTTIRL